MILLCFFQKLKMTQRLGITLWGGEDSLTVGECDAAIMEENHLVGAPVRVACRVMDWIPHSLLVGDGGAAFAREKGFTIESNDHMLSALQDLLEQKQSVSGHDTLADLLLSYFSVVFTSGAPFKSPGRVEDSPLLGCRLYTEHIATRGDGDKRLRHCPSFHAVQLMKQASSSNEACHVVLDDILRRTAPDRCFEVGLITLNAKMSFLLLDLYYRN
uniref:Uncharacterized protein n=1 Tax=Salmo trutta TaxID=8032 RepID=A0A673XAC9_SALTR